MRCVVGMSRVFFEQIIVAKQLALHISIPYPYKPGSQFDVSVTKGLSSRKAARGHASSVNGEMQTVTIFRHNNY